MAEFDPVEFLKSTEKPSSGDFNPDTFLKETAPAPSEPAMTPQQRYRQTLKAYHDQGTENPDVAPGYVSPETSKAFEEAKANTSTLGSQWGEVGKGAAKGLAGGLSGGFVGDIESLGRLPFQIPGVREYIADVSPHTAIPTSEEGGYLGPRGLGAFNAPETPEEKGGAFIGSMFSPNVVSGVAKAVGKGIKHIAGQATFVGPKALEVAYSAGKEGGEAAQAFRENITKSIDLADIIPEVKSSIDNMRAARNAGYVSDMKELGKNVTPLNFDEIDKAVARSTQVKTFKGQDLSPATTKIRQEMNDAIKEWRSLDPAEYHTPVGMDALKQKLGDFMDNTLPRTPERVAASDIYNAVRKTIIKEAPEYATIMKAYENSSAQIKEIEKALSLGNNASADTGLRKLQSILRDNVNASYGSREQLAKYLIANGSPHLMEKLAGQALSPYTPRGLGKLAQNVGAHMAAIAAAASTGGVAPILTFMAGVPISSPRLMGNLSYLSGVAARYGEKIPAKAAIRTGILADTVTPDGTQPRTIPQITIHKEPSRATGGSVFDKMHMARKRAEGGGTDAPFNEWDAVPRNAEGTPQIRIQKPPVNEADEAQAAREAAAARVAGNVRGAPYEPTPPSTEGKTWMMEPGKEAVQSGNYEMPPNVQLNDAGIPYNVETGEELQMARRPSVLPLTRTPDGVQWAMPKIAELAGDIVNPLAVTKGVALNPGEFALGSGPIKRSVLEQANAPTFYSALDRAVADIPQTKASAEQWAATLANRPGVKPEEIQWRGLDQYLAGRQGQTVTKQEIADHLAGNKVELGQTVKGGYDRPGPLSDGDVQAFHDLSNEAWNRTTTRERAQLRQEAQQYGSAGDPKYAKYQLPGGENYSEKLLTLPVKMPKEFSTVQKSDGSWALLDDSGREILARPTKDVLDDVIKSNPGWFKHYRSPHWHEPNPVTHMRSNERTVGNTASHHIEEVQSDWHQKGRDKGYTSATPAERAEWKDIYSLPDKVRTPEQQARMDALYTKMSPDAVPDAPFKKTWPDLTMKQALRDAVENGKDRLSWTPGEAQAARYDLSQHVKEIEYVKNSDGTYRVGIADKDGEPIRSLPGIDVNRMTMAQIEATVGKEVAVKIENGAGRRYRGHDGHTLEGLDLKVGGEGMNEFYDKMLPKAVEKLGKAYGVKVQRGVDTTGSPVNYIDIPPAWKQEILKKGFPLFATGGSVFDKMHMARKRAEGGGTDAPFNEWDAVPRNAEGIPQIRIQKPPVNEADEAQAAREVAHDPNNIGMSEADHGGFASTGKKLSEGIIPKMFDAIVGEPSRQMKPTGWPAGSEEDDYLNAVKRRDAMYWGPDMALNMVGIGGPLAMMNAGKNAIGIAGGRGLTAFKKDTGDFLSKNNLPAITPEQNLANIKSRIRQIEYDRRLSKIDGEAYPNNPELTSLRSRARELGNPALPMDSGFLLGSGTKDKTTGKAVAAEQLANALEQPNAPTLPNKRASAEDINRAADESAGMTQAELRALYNELGITGTPPSSLVKTALADQPKSAIDAATSMKLEDIAAMNKLSKKDRELFVKGKLPNFVLPSQEAAAPARIEFDKVRKEIKKAETEFDLLRATGDEPRLFDLSSKALNKVPDVDQFRLPRVEPKITERLQPAYAGGAGLKRLERAAEKASSADYGWYQLQQIRDMMNSVHGPKKGEMVWNAWLDSLAGTSMVNPISSNVRGSTYYLREALSGRPLPQSIPVVDPKTGNVRWTLAGAPEAGYGAKAQIQHADRVREFMAHEGDPIANPKPMSYRQNLGGNWKPRTVDTHDIRNAVGMPHAVTFGENAGLLPGEYAALEQLGEKAASRSGVPQAAQQAATWIGGGAYTKLKSIPIPLLNEINRRIHVTAKINGVAPDVLWRNVLRGKEILKFAGGSVLDKMKRASK